MKFNKKFTVAVSIFTAAMMNINALAGVLGEITSEKVTGMGGQTVFYQNSYQNGSTKQKEYYVEYKPNEGVVPIVVNGDKIYGKRTVKEAVEYMKDNNMKPMMGINGDYFSYQTGIPMGHTIMDGKLITSDTTGQNAVGFNKDGTGFISWLQIQSRFIKADGSEMYLDCINKWCQPTINASYLLTDYFGKSTKTSGNCKFIVFSPVEGDLKIGGTIKLKVDEKFDYEGEIAIPEGKYVLVMTNTYGLPDKLAFMDSLNVDDVVELETLAVYDSELWNNADSGIGSVGGRLIENGTVNSNFEAGTAPRTAVGIKADGTIIFYVIDGRQTGVSTGVQIKTLAKRMAELGCVDALNLDGGGSTVISGVFPGSDEYSVVNSPSDGSLRKCANYIFLKDMRTPTGVPEFFGYNVSENRNYLSGYSEPLQAEWVVDTGGYYLDAAEVEFTVNNSEYTNIGYDGHNVTVRGNGQAQITASMRGVTDEITYAVFETPDTIKISSEGKGISEIALKVGDSISYDLDASAYVNNTLLHSNDSSFAFSCDSEIGTIDENGVFIPDTSTHKEGSILVRAGEKTLYIPVTVERNTAFADTEGHWAAEFAELLFEKGIVTGEVTDNGNVYRPDSNITRGEFAVITSRFLGLDTKDYPDAEFADSSSTAEWVKPYINAVSALGIMTGRAVDGQTKFCAEDTITRAEAIAVLGRIANTDSYTSDIFFVDGADVPAYAAPYVNLMTSLGIINGYDDGTLRPNGKITRGECAKIICKSIETLEF